MKLKITFGAMAPTISEQIKRQGAEAALQLLDQWQRDSDAITWLALRCLLSETEVYKARRRLMREILHGTRPAKKVAV